MKIQMTLNDSTLDLVIAQLRPVLEAPFFMCDGRKFTGGELTVHALKDASRAIRGEKRPMIFFRFNGASAFIFDEGDTIVSYGTDKVVVKGETEKVFSKTTVTAAEAKRITETARLNKKYEEENEKQYWADVEAEMLREMERDLGLDDLYDEY